MKLNKLATGTRFSFPDDDMVYRVVYKRKDTIHFVGLTGYGTYIIPKSSKKWNAKVEMA